MCKKKNSRLRKAVADLALDNQILNEASSGNVEARMLTPNLREIA